MDTPRLVDHGPEVETAGLVHRVLEPASPGPHPTAILLHGRSGNEDVMWIFARALPAGWLVVAPRGIKPDPDGGYAWHPRKRDEWPSLVMFDQAVAALARFVEALPGLYQADLNRLYLMGFSQGAATAYALAMRRAGLVKGIAGLVGFVPVECDAAIETAALKGLPIFMAVGKEDPLIPYERAKACAQTLRAAGADLEYHEYDTGHKLNAEGLRHLKAWWRQL
ncbi:MAG: dienelactone hydrolase family protein [Chloroflexi bacterium]|nr:dienelactone hydrolase family protein [Chloroflexota bacterium]MCI0580304.1 dienelactone hydrolase family protein [Chloroflexota bacterium]MCI0648077.1 dienelactone hydrolase family protein [Chloroflexota bacterium]MCI0730908.1 dienelactone hydrolase family protein [Chloroflexota bacterium]